MFFASLFAGIGVSDLLVHNPHRVYSGDFFGPLLSVPPARCAYLIVDVLESPANSFTVRRSAPAAASSIITLADADLDAIEFARIFMATHFRVG